MKKILAVALIAFSINVKAQVATLEHVYDSASVWNTCHGNYEQLMIVNFELLGQQYVRINTCAKIMNIYNLNHSLVKSISLAGFPTEPPYNTFGEIIYITQQLFDTDPKIEFMYCYNFTDKSGNSQNVTNIYNEDATLLFADTSSPLIRTNFEQQQLPIYNTPVGTKMILSCTNGQAKVFALKGTLPCGDPCSNTAGNGTMTGLNKISSGVNNNASGMLSYAFPNPARTGTTINYTLPDGITEGEIVFYDIQGKEIKRFKIDNTFSTLQVSTSDIASGTYYYQLQTSGNYSAGKKLVVIK